MKGCPLVAAAHPATRSSYRSPKRTLVGFAVLATVLFSLPRPAAAEDEYYELMTIFVDTFEQIDRNYVKDVDKRQLVDAAVRGMLLELDPYSNYISPDQLSDFTEDIEQEFGGIGVQVNFDRRTKSLIVMAPLPGSPAFKVGMRTGDRIVAINGEKLADFPAGREQAEALSRLRGPAGEPVEVSVFRPVRLPDEDATGNATDDKDDTPASQSDEGDSSSQTPKPQRDDGQPDDAQPDDTQSNSTESDDSDSVDDDAAIDAAADTADDDRLLSFQIVRQTIQLPSVFGHRRISEDEWDYLLPSEGAAPKIAYVRISSFTRRTGEELRTAMEAITDAGADGLVLDLRDNPGGLLTAAVEVVDLFLESGRIVSTEGRNSRPRKWQASLANTYAEIPIAVLINGFSASASEITAAALQDHDRATVIGTRSFGKGSVQNVIDLQGGEAALKLTTASYLRPSGKNIHRFPDSKPDDDWGVRPTDGFTVEMEPAEMAQVRAANRKAYEMTGGDRPEVDDSMLDRAIEVLMKAVADQRNALSPAA